MRIAEADIFIVPGLTGGTDDHWYSRWAAKLPTARRVQQADWHNPNLEAWMERLIEAVHEARRPAVLVAHSLGCITVAHAAAEIAVKVAGAFLVAPPSREVILSIAEIDPAFAAVPRDPLPFPAVLIASRDDSYADFLESEKLAADWRAELVDAGASGHINNESGHGPWPEGLMRFAGFLKTL
jgi:predicted alpha/beta hydrolase family esterase